MAMALSYASWGERDFGNLDGAREMARRQMAISAENGFPFWLTTASALAGWVEAQEQNSESGVARIESAMATLHAIGGFINYPQVMSALAEAYLVSGRHAKAFTVVNEAIAFCEGKISGHIVPRLLRLRADILVARREGEAAEADYRRALGIFGEQGASWFQLQAAIGLARLLRNTNRGAEARSLLSPLYARFAEGLELPDLTAARALLAELS
jgi:predicted ATPase